MLNGKTRSLAGGHKVGIQLEIGGIDVHCQLSGWTGEVMEARELQVAGPAVAGHPQVVPPAVPVEHCDFCVAVDLTFRAELFRAETFSCSFPWR